MYNMSQTDKKHSDFRTKPYFQNQLKDLYNVVLKLSQYIEI
jgi:hypothetical protein